MSRGYCLCSAGLLWKQWLENLQRTSLLWSHSHWSGSVLHTFNQHILGITIDGTSTGVWVGSACQPSGKCFDSLSSKEVGVAPKPAFFLSFTVKTWRTGKESVTGTKPLLKLPWWKIGKKIMLSTRHNVMVQQQVRARRPWREHLADPSNVSHLLCECLLSHSNQTSHHEMLQEAAPHHFQFPSVILLLFPLQSFHLALTIVNAYNISLGIFWLQWPNTSYPSILPFMLQLYGATYQHPYYFRVCRNCI